MVSAGKAMIWALTLDALPDATLLFLGSDPPLIQNYAVLVCSDIRLARSGVYLPPAVLCFCSLLNR